MSTGLFPAPWLFPSSGLYPEEFTPPDAATFAARLFEELAPFQPLDLTGHLWVFCDAIGSMFQDVEDLTSMREDGLPGWATLLDVQRIPIDKLGYLAQFVGVDLMTGLDESAQRQWVEEANNFERCRPAALISAVKATLVDTRSVVLEERTPNPWRYTVLTRQDETVNPALTEAAIKAHKPGPDQYVFLPLNGITYDYLDSTHTTYDSIDAAYATYQAITEAHII